MATHPFYLPTTYVRLFSNYLVSISSCTTKIRGWGCMMPPPWSVVPSKHLFLLSLRAAPLPDAEVAALFLKVYEGWKAYARNYKCSQGLKQLHSSKCFSYLSEQLEIFKGVFILQWKEKVSLVAPCFLNLNHWVFPQ